VGGATEPLSTGSREDSDVQQWSQPFEHQLKDDATYTADLETNHGTITIELYPEDAPKTVNNFVSLAREGFYDGTVFHRIVKASWCRAATRPARHGRAGYKFDDERIVKDYEAAPWRWRTPGEHEWQPVLHRAADMQGRLPKNYTIFGKVTSGMDVVNTIGDQQVARSRSGEVSSRSKRSSEEGHGQREVDLSPIERRATGRASNLRKPAPSHREAGRGVRPRSSGRVGGRGRQAPVDRLVAVQELDQNSSHARVSAPTGRRRGCGARRPEGAARGCRALGELVGGCVASRSDHGVIPRWARVAFAARARRRRRSTRLGALLLLLLQPLELGDQRRDTLAADVLIGAPPCWGDRRAHPRSG